DAQVETETETDARVLRVVRIQIFVDRLAQRLFALLRWQDALDLRVDRSGLRRSRGRRNLRRAVATIPAKRRAAPAGQKQRCGEERLHPVRSLWVKPGQRRLALLQAKHLVE